MAFALVANSVRIYTKEVEEPLRNTFPVILEASFTALAADTALNLATLAAAGSTNDHKAIVDLLTKVARYNWHTFFESTVAAAAATTTHTLTGSAAAPVFTFAGGGTTPTALTLTIEFRQKNDTEPTYYKVGAQPPV